VIVFLVNAAGGAIKSPDASGAAYPLDDDARRALHVAVPRASHQLWVVSVGSPSPLLAGTRR